MESDFGKHFSWQVCRYLTSLEGSERSGRRSTTSSGVRRQSVDAGDVRRLHERSRFQLSGSAEDRREGWTGW